MGTNAARRTKKEIEALKNFLSFIINRKEVNMPGKKYASIKRPKTYEALRDKGMSKTRAAKISNAQAKKAKSK
jgi:hypothetical protein